MKSAIQRLKITLRSAGAVSVIFALAAALELVNSVVVEDVPVQSTVVGIPGKAIKGGIPHGCELEHQQIR